MPQSNITNYRIPGHLVYTHSEKQNKTTHDPDGSKTLPQEQRVKQYEDG